MNWAIVMLDVTREYAYVVNKNKYMLLEPFTDILAM